jgi:hypothetical protein
MEEMGDKYWYLPLTAKYVLQSLKDFGRGGFRGAKTALYWPLA